MLFVFFALTTGGKIYYLAGAYIYLLAAGAVAIDGWLAARAGRLRRLLLATAVCTALAVPLVLPVLPPGDVAWTQKINPVLAESVGWPQLVGTVRTAWFSLPAGQRASAVIFASNYGEASAINVLRAGNRPPAGRKRAQHLLVVGPGQPAGDHRRGGHTRAADGRERRLPRPSSSPACEPSRRCSNPYGLHNQEWHGPATCTCAPARAAPGARRGRSCASTADRT